jgi:hypothetical protein
MRASRKCRRGTQSLIRVVALGLMAALAVACNEGAADEALRAAAQALDAAPELKRETPDEFAAIEGALKDARASYEAGHYTDALRAAQRLPDRIAAARELAASRARERAAEWDALARELPQRLDALAARLTLLVTGGWISSERQEQARAAILELDRAWGNARSAFDAGDPLRALSQGRAVKARAASLAASLGMKPAPFPGAPGSREPALAPP